MPENGIEWTEFESSFATLASDLIKLVPDAGRVAPGGVPVESKGMVQPMPAVVVAPAMALQPTIRSACVNGCAVIRRGQGLRRDVYAAVCDAHSQELA